MRSHQLAIKGELPPSCPNRPELRCDFLQEIHQGISSHIGADFFHGLVKQLVLSTKADYAFISELVAPEKTRCRTVANFAGGEQAENFEYDLEGSPCAEVLEEGLCSVPTGFQKKYPLDHNAAEIGIDSYLGIALNDADGAPIGIMSILGRAPMRGGEKAESILRIFALRASAELARRQEELGRREQLHFLQVLVDAMPNPIYYKGVDGLFLGCNLAFEKVVGKTREEIVGKTLFDIHAFAGKNLHRQYYESDRRLLDEEGVQTLESTVVYADGTRHEVLFNKATFLNSDGSLGGLVGTIHDITDRKDAERKVEQLAYYDGLTGLANQVMLKKELECLLAATDRGERPAGVLFLALDRFEVIRDTLGHSICNKLLQAVAVRLSNLLRLNDEVARLEGEKFAVTLASVADADDAAAYARQILRALSTPIEIQGLEIHSTASIGIALTPGAGEGVGSLIENADTALQQARGGGRNSFVFYSRDIRRQNRDRLILENCLRHAIKRDEFFLHYQPQMDLDSGHVTGVEALLRWNHPERGMIPPDKFIPLAEESGLILPIGELVLKMACAQNRAWQDAGFEPIRMAVNLSGHQLQQPELIDIVTRTLRETGLDPSFLELELTESTMMENTEENINVLRKLKNRGIHLALDDFGTGYSSLGYLKRFPIDLLKIDRSFVRDLPADADDVAITETIIAMAHTLGLKVLAEGVETEEQLEFLRERKCEQVQGYYLSRPLRGEEVEKFLRRKEEVPTGFTLKL